MRATIFADGHDILRAAVRHRAPGLKRWSETPMEPLGNDRWRGSFQVGGPGRWQYALTAWIDRFASWRHELERKVAAGQADLAGELAEGAALLGVEKLTVEQALEARARPAARGESSLAEPLELIVDRERASFGAWYELFPRSFGGFAGVEQLLPELAALGFDVLYFPPIHPIGRTHRKGKNNALTAGPGDPGSPWAIGARRGRPRRRSRRSSARSTDLEDLVAAAAEHGLELALDLALQCSPDHPWLKRAPGVVLAPARRHAQVRREPAQALSGHLQPQLRLRGLAGPLAGAARARPRLGRARDPDLPRRQPAHEAGRVLGAG